MKRVAPWLFLGLLVIPALVLADIPLSKFGPTAFTASGNMPKITLAGQSTCAMTLSGGGSATITPMGSSDNNNTYTTVASIGAQTANGTYGGPVAPYLTNFYVAVTGVTGTVNVSEVCSATITAQAGPAGPSGPPGPTGSPGPLPSTPISLVNGGTATSSPNPTVTETACAGSPSYSGSFPSQTLSIPTCNGAFFPLNSSSQVLATNSTSVATVYKLLAPNALGDILDLNSGAGNTLVFSVDLNGKVTATGLVTGVGLAAGTGSITGSGGATISGTAALAATTVSSLNVNSTGVATTLFPFAVTQFTASGTFTSAANSTTATVYEYTMCAAGGGGGGANGTAAAGGGGGSGACGIGTFTGLAASTGMTVTVGTGGSAGSTAGGTGGTGGTSILASPGSVTCNAGLGGIGSTGTTSAAVLGGAGGATATGCTLVGTVGWRGLGYVAAMAAGNGASSIFGGGGVGGNITNTGGGAGVAPGTGGGGGVGSGTAGGAGAPGIVMIKRMTP